MHTSTSNPREYEFKQQRADRPLLLQAFLNFGNAFLEFALLGACPSPQNQRHGAIVHKLMLFAERDGRVSLACDERGFAAQLVHAQAYCSRHCIAERVPSVIGITAGIRTLPQRLIWITEKPEGQRVV